MADQYMKDPVRVFVGSLDLNVSTVCCDSALDFSSQTRAGSFFLSLPFFTRKCKYMYMKALA